MSKKSTVFSVRDGVLVHGRKSLRTVRELVDFVGDLGISVEMVEEAIRLSIPTEVDPKGYYAIAARLNKYLESSTH